MKHLILTLFLVLIACSGWAAPNQQQAGQQNPDMGLLNKVFAQPTPPKGSKKPAEAAKIPSYSPSVLAQPDYISKTNVRLNSKEWEALKLSKEWINRKINPILLENGKVVYIFGATMPTIICSPFMASDLELQPGENVNDVIVGDTARWLVTVGQSGTPGRESTHIILKPLDAGLVTTAVITTDRRVYHLKLVSRRKDYNPYVSFIYPEDQQKIFKDRLKRKQKKDIWNTTQIEQKTVDLSTLDFSYTISGDDASWKPMRVYNDGIRTFIQLPRTSTQTEIPVLLVEKAGQEAIVNYRVKGNAMIVDEIFEKAILVAGTGMDQAKVEITRVEVTK
ncbi:P-type conjugative transfer protein TrbG [Desulfovibrio sp. JC010]|uniref:P-type conjugative transfer protein TrbG n=1 Tax=Desulfovibrio sp. JC010 TaxID=2593641 RepID=UPI0013D3BA16|nr:P-type conjugative transfer protein TrbG [Desulfovibrio sp. JC010]NDV26921.1 P-type conjugative transfer protein TrbG [Desulfovibrio sp. JC010]